MNEKNKYPKFPENCSLGEKCTFGYTNNIKLQTKRTIFMKPEGYVIFCYKEYNDKFVKYPIIKNVMCIPHSSFYNTSSFWSFKFYKILFLHIISRYHLAVQI